MDRFIVYKTYCYNKYVDYLKSNMDRFIEPHILQVINRDFI